MGAMGKFGVKMGRLGVRTSSRSASASDATSRMQAQPESLLTLPPHRQHQVVPQQHSTALHPSFFFTQNRHLGHRWSLKCQLAGMPQEGPVFGTPSAHSTVWRARAGFSAVLGSELAGGGRADEGHLQVAPESNT